MPVIPMFDQSLAIPQPAQAPRMDPAAAGVAGGALARGAGQVSDEMAAFQQKYADARRQADAANANYDAGQELIGLQSKWGKLSDSQVATDGFTGEVQQIKQKYLLQNTDPQVQSYFTQMFDRDALIRAAATHQESFGREASARVGDIDTHGAGYANQIATATNPVEVGHALDLWTAELKGSAQAGWLRPDEVNVRLSHVLHTAIVLKGETDPVAAQALLDAYKDRMTTMDLQRSVTRLTPQVQRRQAEDIASGIVGGLGGGGGDVANAIHSVESGGAATSPTSADGARGGWQIMPDTFAQYAKPGENIDTAADNEAVGRRIVDDLKARYQNDPARVAVGYFSGPGNVAPPGSPTPWVADKKDGNGQTTSGYVAKVLSRIGPSAPLDMGELYSQVMAKTAGMPFEVQQHALSLVLQRAHEISAASDGQRVELNRQVGNLVAGYEQGLTDPPIPEDRIRSLFRPADADRMVSELQLSRTAGDAFKAVQGATPDEEAATRAALAVPGTLIADRGGPSGPAPANTPELMQWRDRLVKKFDQLVATKRQQLDSDPAAYAAGLPDVQARAKAIDPANPDTMAAYSTALLAAQTRLGVPDYAQHILTKGQAGDTVARLLTTDPTKGDMGAALDGLKKQYGDSWPRVFGDLQSLGRLPAEWQTLGIMPDPAARAQFQRALQAGGAAKLRDAVPAGVVRDIDTGLDGEIEDFRKTAAVPGLGINSQLIDSLKNSVKTLAYSEAISGASAADALASAKAAVFGKYDFDGTMRVPKGMLPQVHDAGAAVLSSLKASDLMPMAAGDNLTDVQRQAITLRNAQRGIWVPNEADDGLVLAAKQLNGNYTPIRRVDGSRIELRFAALPATQAAPAPQGPPGLAEPLEMVP